MNVHAVGDGATPLDVLAAALHAACAYNAAAEAAPEAVLWCDPAGEFAPVLPALRERLPGLLTLGPYDPATRTGPALWLRAASARQVPGVDWPAEVPPVLHLPGFGREALRDAESCPAELNLLAWFAVAGCFFGQPKQARDWTLRAFLAAQGSPVDLDVPDDGPTRAALARAAPRLFAEPLAALRGQRWDAAALDGLLVENPDADMLAWMDGVLTPLADPDRFAAFAGLAAKRFSFDPRKRSREDAAALLAEGEKNWGKVWGRFSQATAGHDEVVRLLGLHEPKNLFTPQAYPAENAKREAALRAALLALAEKPAGAAAQAIRELEAAHHWRRDTVWARRGQARLAQVLLHLVVLAIAAPLPGHDASALAEAYVAAGWRVDAAALAALALAPNGEDRQAVATAVRAVYLPWLEAAASALQALAAAGKVGFARPTPMAAPEPAAVLLFVDGLRMDLAQRLADMLQAGGAVVTRSWRWSGFPTVTATCKPLASPAAGLLAGGAPQDLSPTYEGKAAVKPVLMKAIAAAGWTTGDALLADAPLWTEGRSIDQAGESNGADLLPLLPGILEDIAALALRLARQGRRVRIVTDHGFLLMPGGVPRAELPGHFVAPGDKARRVALLKEGAPASYVQLPWSWNPAVLFATPPGACAFYPNAEYVHGGVSPQECVLPVLDVTAEGTAPKLAVSVRWRGLMAKVKVEGGAGLMADIRVGTGTSGASASLKGPKMLDDAGMANLGLDDAHETLALCVVLYRAEAPTDIVAVLPTRVGE